MAIRKTVEETLVVDGKREDWLGKCAGAMRDQDFTRISESQSLYEVTADYKKWRPGAGWGTLAVTLHPEGERTRMVLRATANVDNIWALFRSPGRQIIDRFKAGLP